MKQNDIDMNWKTLDSKYLFKKPWLTARVDKVQRVTCKSVWCSG